MLLAFGGCFFVEAEVDWLVVSHYSRVVMRIFEAERIGEQSCPLRAYNERREHSVDLWDLDVLDFEPNLQALKCRS